MLAASSRNFLMKPSSLYQVLYVSKLCADQPLTVVADIVHRARVANEGRGITALLVFDGEYFCQLIEGDERPVLSLAGRIYDDPRHQEVEVLHHGLADKRRFKGFEVAFTDGEEELTLAPLCALDGRAAVEAFDALRVRLPM